MDPLSIAASAVTLIEAVGKVTKVLYDVVQAIRTADARLSTLNKELQSLLRFLKAVNDALRQCQSRRLALAPIDDDLWQESAAVLEDCKASVDELNELMERITSGSRAGGLLRKTKLATSLGHHESELTGFQDKIYKSNSALKTILAVIQVSLSLRGDASQQLILDELDQLRTSIEYVLKASEQNVTGRDARGRGANDHLDVRIDQHLRRLARTAQQFHYTHSSTVASSMPDNGTVIYPLQRGVAASTAGDLSFAKRKQVEDYIAQQREPKQREAPPAADETHREPPATTKDEDSEDQLGSKGSDAGESESEDDEDEHEMLYTKELENLARESIVHKDLLKAESCLEQAIQRLPKLDVSDAHFQRLQLQLAVCYILGYKWLLAKPLVLTMMTSRRDMVACNLLHAVSIAHLGEFQFDQAVETCKRALKHKKRLGGVSNEESQTTLGLLATIHEMQEEPIWAEVYRRQMQPTFAYSHPQSEVDFICKHPSLLRSVFGDDFPLPWQPLPTTRAPRATHNIAHSAPDEDPPIQLDGAFQGQGLTPRPSIRHRVKHSEKLELDTMKEILPVLEEDEPADDVQPAVEAVPAPTVAFTDTAQSPRAGSFGRKLGRMFGTIAVRRGRSSRALRRSAEESDDSRLSAHGMVDGPSLLRRSRSVSATMSSMSDGPQEMEAGIRVDDPSDEIRDRLRLVEPPSYDASELPDASLRPSVYGSYDDVYRETPTISITSSEWPSRSTSWTTGHANSSRKMSTPDTIPEEDVDLDRRGSWSGDGPVVDHALTLDATAPLRPPPPIPGRQEGTTQSDTSEPTKKSFTGELEDTSAVSAESRRRVTIQGLENLVKTANARRRSKQLNEQAASTYSEVNPDDLDTAGDESEDWPQSRNLQHTLASLEGEPRAHWRRTSDALTSGDAISQHLKGEIDSLLAPESQLSPHSWRNTASRALSFHPTDADVVDLQEDENDEEDSTPVEELTNIKMMTGGTFRTLSCSTAKDSGYDTMSEINSDGRSVAGSDFFGTPVKRRVSGLLWPRAASEAGGSSPLISPALMSPGGASYIADDEDADEPVRGEEEESRNGDDNDEPCADDIYGLYGDDAGMDQEIVSPVSPCTATASAPWAANTPLADTHDDVATACRREQKDEMLLIEGESASGTSQLTRQTSSSSTSSIQPESLFTAKTTELKHNTRSVPEQMMLSVETLPPHLEEFDWMSKTRSGGTSKAAALEPSWADDFLDTLILGTRST